MESESHPIKQEITAAQLLCDAYGNPVDFRVGIGAVTRIEACEKNGEYCMIPYIRVWDGEKCMCEFSQHKANFIVFK